MFEKFSSRLTELIVLTFWKADKQDRNKLVNDIADYIADLPETQLTVWERPDGSPGNGVIPMKPKAVAEFVRKKFSR